MLDFYPEQKPHTPYFEEMTDHIPPGGFYLKTVEMVARSILASRFVLITDTEAPVEIYVNNVLVKTVIPTGRQIITVPLAVAPSINNITATNNIDPSVNLSIASTYMATYMEALATQHYEVAGRITEMYTDFLSSPWAAFIAEWLLPWADILPDIRTLKSLALKLEATSLYTEASRQKGEMNLVTGLCCSTPVLQNYRNPEEWQPHLYQPVTQADDTNNIDLHVWLPNLCVGRWLAFVTLITNLKQFALKAIDENIVIVHDTTNDFTTQHYFDFTGGTGCSIADLLAVGCMDELYMSGLMEFTNRSALCYWSRTLDNIVEYPGIGGRFLDLSKFDLSGHKVADDTNRSARYPAYDIASACNLLSYFIPSYNNHDNDSTPIWHYAIGGSHQVTAALPFDLASLQIACLDIQTQYTAHLADTSMHNPADTTYVLGASVTATATEEELVIFCNELLIKYNDHIAFASFDTLYDIDKLTNYWVGTSISKPLDAGACFDTKPTAISPDNLSCCTAGPDTKLLCTIMQDQDITSSVTPNNPVFGGDSPGLLYNPYFSIL